MLKNYLLTAILATGFLTLLGEGSKNLTPSFGSGDGTTNNNFIGYLCHSQEGGITGDFLVPGSAADTRLYVYVKEGETLYMGLRRIDPVTNNEARHEDLTIVVRENDGTLVTSFTLTDNDAVTDANGDSQSYPFDTPQTGVIDSYAEVLAGPQQVVGGSGYDALEWTNSGLGDQEFYIEFIQFDGGSTNSADDIYVESWYDLWDFSVYDGNEEKTGRLHSKNWGFTAGSFTNQFSDDFTMYVTVPSEVAGSNAGSYIKQIDFAGIQPYTTLVYANSMGAILGSTSDLNGDGVVDFQDTRRSQSGNIGELEYDIYINNPDLDIYPTTTLPSVDITDATFFCNDSGTGGSGAITFTANQSGIITILLDLNGVTGYQSGTSDIVVEKEIDASSGSAIETIIWDGLDGLGATVPSGTSINISGRFTSGSLHVPLFDPEINSIGVNMQDVRPATSFDLIYWDDRSEGGLGSTVDVELDGTNNQQHTWTDGNGILVNTWSFGYYQINTENVTFSYECDIDGDGITGTADLDSDNDGLADTEEGDHNADTDGDGIPDYLDPDVDGDGDVDVADNWADTNNDGVNDNYDSDLDGVPNALDTDSDNDGIPDLIEAGLTDGNNDGTLDEGAGITDANSNGLADAYDPACDGLSIPTAATGGTDAGTTGTVTNSANIIDNDNGTFGILDNNSAIMDVQLAGPVPVGNVITIRGRRDDNNNSTFSISQSTDDGTYTNTVGYTGTNTITDYTYTVTGSDASYIRIDRTNNRDTRIYHISYTYLATAPCSGGIAITPTDTDSDGFDNYLDIDSDNDGIVDTWEAGGTADSSNGQISGYTDSNGNGWNDAQEIGSLSIPDTDGDGALPDYLDLDADNDGIPDNYEGQNSAGHIEIAAGDTDGNGLLDIYDPNNGGTFITPVDTDSDGDDDFKDSDADDDGVADLIEGWDNNADGYGDWDATGSNNDISDETGYNTDSDSDGLWDVFDNDAGTGISNIIGSDVTRQNTDGADNADWQDEDDDNDGSLTAGEDVNSNNNWSDDFTQGQGGSATIPDYLYRGDYDGDAIANKNDLDSDNDGIMDSEEDNGESIDPSGDDDNDGIANYKDSDVSGSLSSAADTNGDGIFDVFDTDLDGVPDFLDLDSDNDGLWDALEAYQGSVPNGLDQTTGQFTLNDPDNDGLMNYIDSSPASIGGISTLANPDSDGDGFKDYLDIDSDGDGILDLIESQTTSSLINLSNIDSDGDGIDDNFDPDSGGTLIIPVNSDGLDLQDYLDDDSDNDNVPDLIEGNDGDRDGATDATPSGTDTDNDGLDDVFDPDNGGTLPVLQNTDGVDELDWRDVNDDNDAFLTADEDNNSNGDYSDDNTNGQGISTIPDYLYNGDFDNDGIPDYDDLDDDNDGILDSEEGYDAVVLVNGSLEEPIVTGATPYITEFTNGGFLVHLYDEANVPGWNTTATDNAIEVWESGFQGVPSYDGNQHIEINATEDAQLYQDVATEPGTLIYWSIAHRGRSGTDEFKILIGPTSGPVDNGTFATGNTAWAVYSGFYLVPSGQTTTRFAFESVSTSGGNNSVGNFIDNFSLFATLSGTDEDGDGLPNYLDRDSNNNGIADIIEAGGIDADGDGEVDSFTDTDTDGLHDPYDADNGGASLISGDSDGDGVLDVLDLDSDNDGIPDITEAGGTDSDGDGRVDDPTDTDEDGFADLHDIDNGGSQLGVPDSDFDLIPDFKDLDSDNDGITDAVENGGDDTNSDGLIDNYSNDSDGDGYADAVDPDSGGTPISVADTDNDGIDNFRDLDADNDGYPDILEAGGVDTDNDGRVDDQLDQDEDGIPDAVDVDQTGGGDSDGDGIADLYDVTNTGGNDDDGDGIDNIYDEDMDGNGYSDAIEAAPYDILDSDGDGHKNFQDIDSDNDGIVDVLEFGETVNTSTGTIDGFTDTDSDGLNDAQDGYLGQVVNGSVSPITPSNSDTSTEPTEAIRADYIDIDSDNDGIVDFFEAQTKASLVSLSGIDADNNGLDDAFDPNQGNTLITPVNTDGTGNADYLDDDSDGDTFSDLIEGDNANKDLYGDWDSNTNTNFDDSGFDDDTDSDGLLDIFDVIASVGSKNIIGSNAAVQDTDHDGIWDFQDTDDDNDGIATGSGGGDDTDAFTDDSNGIIPDYLFGDPDIDNDGVTNDNDLDSDNDGVANTSEDGGTGIDPSADDDSDGLYNFEDPDIDGDGTANTADTSTSGVNTTSFTDTNADGIIDQFDSDKDGIPDFKDLDSDNDGIADIIEFGIADTDENGTVDGFTDVIGSGTVSYTISTGCSTTIESTTGHTTGPTSDDGSVNPTLPFDFDFYGTTFTAGATTTLNANAWFSLDNINPGSPWNAVSVPNGTYTNTIFMNHRDHTPNTGGTVTYGTNGSGANEIFVITFDNVPFYTGSGTATTQLQLHETTNEIRIITTNFNPGSAENTTMALNQDGTTSDAVGGRNSGNYTITTAECQSFLPTSGGNGLDDTYDAAPVTPPDTDGDGIADYLDLDSDNDGITDNVEAQPAGSYVTPVLVDTDGDGILDVYDEDISVGNAIDPVNTDGTDNDDFLDDDSDNDGVADNIEGWDTDKDGYADWDTDNNNDPSDETGYGSDTDSDGIYYLFDSNNGKGTVANISGSNASVQDTDGDSTPDYRDIDDDEDGINTVSEDNASNYFVYTQGGVDIPDYLFAPDNDGDGILDAVDADSDNDGITNVDEYNGASYNGNGPFDDEDGDGIYNYLDSSDPNFTFTDINGDGIDDQVDHDKDGVPNFFDLDSDDDGILDAVEANDGIIPSSNFNTNTGRFTGTDNDGDGLVAEVDQADNAFGNQNSSISNPDSDSDGINDFLDLDSDDDGITDNREGQSTAFFITITNTDADENGIKDVYDPNQGATLISPTNTDGDSSPSVVPDYLDNDSDDDNVVDVVEGFDANKNGFSDLDLDQDGDLSDESGFGVDTDGDGLEDLYDNYSGYGIANIKGSKATLQDTDNDTIEDWRDAEDDSDGINTVSEDTSDGAGGGADGIYYNDKNQGGGATPDYLFFNDTDDDGIADGQDLDSDNDGIIDEDEASGVTYSGSNGPFDDDDLDGLFNYLDSDATNFVDNDSDGIDDRVDQDSDGVPNFFDLDSDNDGIPDGVEANSGSLYAGMNSNGQFPNSVADVDQDGLADAIDAGSTSTLVNPDTDGDGLPDFLDLDSDSDGITDLVEAGGNDFNDDGMLDSFGDTDGDGLGNSVDDDNGGTAHPLTDWDGSIPNYIDIDSEDDGIRDAIEGFYESGPTDNTQSYIDRVTAYNIATSGTTYPTDDIGPANGTPDYADDSDGDGLPNLFDPDSPYFLDDDNDGLVNLFDGDQNGIGYAKVSGAPDRDGDTVENIEDTNDIPLPLDFLSFTGKSVNNSISLTWETTNEVNVSHFEVLYRSGEEESFNVIAIVDANNIKSQINRYNYLHTRAEEGNNFYQIREVDFDNYTGYTGVINVSLKKTQIEWTVYPNPTFDEINIQSNAIIPDSRILIYDTQGKVVFEKGITESDSKQLTVDLSQYPSGVYNMVISLPDGKVYQRIMKK